jgi:hypothetical protein
LFYSEALLLKGINSILWIGIASCAGLLLAMCPMLQQEQDSRRATVKEIQTPDDIAPNQWKAKKMTVQTWLRPSN